jgi:hypothetical protein
MGEIIVTAEKLRWLAAEGEAALKPQQRSAGVMVSSCRCRVHYQHQPVVCKHPHRHHHEQVQLQQPDSHHMLPYCQQLHAQQQQQFHKAPSSNGHWCCD